MRFAFILSFASVSLTSWAQPKPPTGLAAFGPALGLTPPERSMVSYGGGEQPDSHAGIGQHRLMLATALYKGETDTLSASVNGGLLHLDKRVVLKDSGTVVPADFYRSELSMHFGRKLEFQRNLGMRVSLGYANDKPFNGSRDLSFTATGTYAFPNFEDSSFWVLSLFVSNNSSFLPNFVPIPGFVYLYKSDKVTGMFGLPVASVQYRPADPWALSLSIFAANLTAEAARGRIFEFQYYAGGAWTHQSYMRAGRADDKDRIYFSEKRAYIGVRTPVVIPIGGDLQFGHAFEREVSEGTSVFKQERGDAQLGASWFVNLNLRFVF